MSRTMIGSLQVFCHPKVRAAPGRCPMQQSSRQSQGSVPDRSDVVLPFAAIVLAMLPAVLDQTVLSTALPPIATDPGRLSDVSWVVTAHGVAAAAPPPPWGQLGGR